MAKRTVEIRPGEGGEDAQIFVGELAKAYEKMSAIFNWKVD